MEKKREPITVSPFEYAIRQIAEPETIDQYREETREEAAARQEKKIREFMGNIKVKSTNDL